MEGSKREVEGKTPNGGVRTTLMFFDDNREPVAEADATSVEVIEYGEDGNVIARNYLRKSQTDAQASS